MRPRPRRGRRRGQDLARPGVTGRVDVAARSVVWSAGGVSLRLWAVKPGELRALDRVGLTLFAARCALRVEGWLPDGAAKAWKSGLELVVRAAFTAPRDPSELRARAGEISNLGAVACNRLQKTDGPRGRCHNYATSALAAALEVACEAERPKMLRWTIDAAKLSASIPAVWAHAGRVKVPKGAHAVDLACTTMWEAIRGDIGPLAAVGVALERARNPVQALRNFAPLWPGERPPWRNGP